MDSGNKEAIASLWFAVKKGIEFEVMKISSSADSSSSSTDRLSPKPDNHTVGAARTALMSAIGRGDACTEYVNHLIAEVRMEERWSKDNYNYAEAMEDLKMIKNHVVGSDAKGCTVTAVIKGWEDMKHSLHEAELSESQCFDKIGEAVKLLRGEIDEAADGLLMEARGEEFV